LTAADRSSRAKGWFSAGRKEEVGAATSLGSVTAFVEEAAVEEERKDVFCSSGAEEPDRPSEAWLESHLAYNY
jgi:hypothetical protein